MKARNELFLVERPQQDPAVPDIFHPGQRILHTGVYRIYHPHRLSHDATLLKGDLFPACLVCGKRVQFELLQSAPEIGDDSNFRRRRSAFDSPIADDAIEA